MKWMRAAGVDGRKRQAMALLTWRRYLATLAAMAAGLTYWHNAALHGAFDRFACNTTEQLRHLALLRRALSHNKLVLLQAIVIDWQVPAAAIAWQL